MKRIIPLAFVLSVVAEARPMPQVITADSLSSVLREWWRAHKDSPQPVLTIGNEPFQNNAPRDVLLWERYRGQTIIPGDLYLADYPDKKLEMACRQARTVTSTHITTISGTTIPLTQVRGVVRRVVRVE